MKLGTLLGLVFAKQADAVDALHHDQQNEGNENADDVARCRFQEIEERADTRNVPGVFAEHVGIGDDGFVVGVCRRAVGHEARLAGFVRRQTADLVRDRRAVVGAVLRGVGDDVTRLERGGVDTLDQNEVARVKVGFLHGVGQNDEGSVAEDTPVCAVKGGDRHDGEDHHADGEDHEEPDQQIADKFQCFHSILPFLGHQSNCLSGLFFTCVAAAQSVKLRSRFCASFPLSCGKWKKIVSILRCPIASGSAAASVCISSLAVPE